MRQLLPVAGTGSTTEDRADDELDDADLARIYAFPDGPWLRMNFVSTLDGAATGPDGRTGTINNAVDRFVFLLQRRLCDAVLVGAETARVEGYRRPTADGGGRPLLVVATSSGHVAPGLLESGRGGGVIVVTSAAAAPDAVRAARDALGADAVWVHGDEVVDLRTLRDRLVAEGYLHVLCEGGPRLHAAMLAAGVVDELALTWVPTLVGGAHPRISLGDPGLDLEEVTLRPTRLLEDSGTLLGLWRVVRS
jgi:riboflavin biosynthesis pyrimidine reductase